jgi:hypothetical protein
VLPVLSVAAVAICVWAWWVAAERDAPAWARVAAVVVAAVDVGVSGYAMWRIHIAFERVREVNPAERQRVLSDELQQAYGALAIGGAVVISAVGVLTWVTLRARGRARRA